MPLNRAAWQISAKAKPLVIQEAPYTSPNVGEVTIKTKAVAINPVDAMLVEFAIFPITYPHIHGYDVAGEVVEVGSGESQFSIGDRVLGFALGTSRAPEGAFQEYTVLKTQMVSTVPKNISFEQAAVMPMGLIVAAYGLFCEEYLNLQHPSLRPTSTGKTLLLWGGATSIGCNTIQLAVAAGYEVVTTASEKNFGLVRQLGARQVFDYHSDSVVDDVLAALKDKEVVGAFDAAGKTSSGAFGTTAQDSSFQLCASILQRTEGNKFIASVQILPVELPAGIEAKFILGEQIKDIPLSKVIFEDFVPKALADGKMVPAPSPLVMGHGLESIQAGLEKMMEGVSAQKIVLTL